MLDIGDSTSGGIDQKVARKCAGDATRGCRKVLVEFSYKIAETAPMMPHRTMDRFDILTFLNPNSPLNRGKTE
jgi:hypothetical protein